MTPPDLASIAPAPSTPAVHDARLDVDSVPGPPAMPIVGMYGNMARFFVDNVRYASMLHANYGNIVAFTRGMPKGLMPSSNPAPAAVFLFGSRFMEQVLIKTASSKYPDAVIGKIPKELGGAARLTSGLLWMDGERHRQHRRMITPLYHQKAVQGYRDLMVSGIQRMLDDWQRDRPVNLIVETGDLLVEFENTFVLGMSEPSQRSTTQSLGDRLVAFYGFAAAPLAHMPLDIPGTPRRRLRDFGDALAAELDELIRSRRAAPEADAHDVLSTLINGRYEDGSSMTHDELVAETLHLFMSGWVSTRAAVTWTALLLAQHPKVSADLHDEIGSVLQGEAPTLEHLKRMPLLDNVLKESLRLFPAIPIVSRASCEPTELGGYRLPARTELFLSIYHTHRQPNVYEQPLRFKPERWNSIQPGPYEYLPWGVGARTCLGTALATIQMKMLFAMLIPRYRLELVRGTKINCGGVGIMKPKPELKFMVRAQDRRFTASKAPVRGTIHEMVDLEA